MTFIAYNNAVADIRVKEYERKREWETLHIVTCLLETVYTHVIHSINSGEPCHPEQTAAEINTCHIVEESMTATLTIGQEWNRITTLFEQAQIIKMANEQDRKNEWETLVETVDRLV